MKKYKFGEDIPSTPNKILKKCGPDNRRGLTYINPKTNNCILLKSSTIQSLLKKGYLLEDKINNVPLSPDTPVPYPQFLPNPSKILKKCGKGKYINPRTNRCILETSTTLKSLLKKGYVLEEGPSGPILKNINNPNINPNTPTILDPPNKNVIKLVYCGPKKVINPKTGRCINLNSQLGKKLTSVPYIIVNPPKPAPLPPKPGKPEKIDKQNPLLPLDTNDDNYISIREYLSSVESKGDKEKSAGVFSFFNQRTLSIYFILALIKKEKGPIHKIGCIPHYWLCIYKTTRNQDRLTSTSKHKYKPYFYTLPNKDIKKKNTNYEEQCPKPDIGKYGPEGPDNKYYYGSMTGNYASIVILNTPIGNRVEGDNGPMEILLPPNLKLAIEKCEKDNKFMVVCDLTLLYGDQFSDSSHANVLIFDTKRKIIERFDPHGGRNYQDVKLVYDDQYKSYTNRQDFQFGIYKLPEDSGIQRSSNTLSNQMFIDGKLRDKFKTVLPDYQYYGTNKTTPYLGPQIKTDALGGLCVTWSTMYMLLRLLNPELSPAEVTIRMIDGSPKQLLNKILRFQKYIVKTLQDTKFDDLWYGLNIKSY